MVGVALNQLASPVFRISATDKSSKRKGERQSRASEEGRAKQGIHSESTEPPGNRLVTPQAGRPSDSDAAGLQSESDAGRTPSATQFLGKEPNLVHAHASGTENLSFTQSQKRNVEGALRHDWKSGLQGSLEF